MLGEQFKNTYHIDESGKPTFYTDPSSSAEVYPEAKARYAELLAKHAANVSAGEPVHTALSKEENVELNSLHVMLHQPYQSSEPVTGVHYSGLLMHPASGSGEIDDPVYTEESKRALAEKAVGTVLTTSGTPEDATKLRDDVVSTMSKLPPKIIQKTNVDVDQLTDRMKKSGTLAAMAASGVQNAREKGLTPSTKKSLQRSAADTELRMRMTARKGVWPDSQIERTRTVGNYARALENPTVDDTKGLLYWEAGKRPSEDSEKQVDPSVRTMGHEIGHHLDPREEAINVRQGDHGTNVVREAYADGFADRELRRVYKEGQAPSPATAVRMASTGYTPQSKRIATNEGSKALYIAVRNHVAMGHALPHFSEFKPDSPDHDSANDQLLLLGHLYTHHPHVQEALKLHGLSHVGAGAAARYARIYTDAAASPKWQQQEFDFGG